MLTINRLLVRDFRYFIFFIPLSFSSRALASCLQSINCPINNKSYGSLILNLLHLLGIHNCELNTSCSHEKRSVILRDLLTHWTDSRLTHNIDYREGNNGDPDNYCQ